MFTYCNNNPINMVDYGGNCPQWIKDTVDWVSENVIAPIKQFCKNVQEDISNFDTNNTDIDKVYQSHYFSSYKGTPVLRHSSKYLSSWSIGGTIYLNHKYDKLLTAEKTQILSHEYGHILQEQEYGTLGFLLVIGLPSVTLNLLSRQDDNMRDNYFNMPWEYDADIRGKAQQAHAWWADEVSKFYFTFFDFMLFGG